MRITFFGSSSGSPGPNMKCSCTLIEIGERKYIIDIGTLLIEQLANRDINIAEINALFVTHMHRDHTDGLPSYYLRLHSPYGKDADPELFIPQMPMQPVIDALDAWRNCNGNTKEARPIKFRQVKEGEIFNDGVLKVTAYPTQHSEVVNTFSYLLEAEGKRVFFSGDFSREPDQEFHYEILEEQLDLAVCELGHFKAEKYGIIFAEKPPKKLIINHISKKNMASAYDFRLVSEFPTVLAHDGMVVDV